MDNQAPPVGTLDQTIQYFDQVGARYRAHVTGFGLKLLAYYGSDGRMHTLVGNGTERNTLFAPWENGAATLMSIVRMREIVEAVDAMSTSIQAQISNENLQQAHTGGEVTRRASDKYAPSEKWDKRFKGWEWEVDGFTLSAEQVDAVKLILSSDRTTTVLTGQAGAGKSAVVRFLQANQLVTVTATTGRAAINVGGTTVDSLFGFNRDKWALFSAGYTESCMRSASATIVVDEASMVGLNMGNLILRIAEQYKKRIVLVGDWAQASPVKDEWGHRSRLVAEANFVRLEECHRQSNELFISVLNKLRIGQVDQEVDQVMSKLVGPCPDEAGWVRMFATNALAKSYNTQALGRHCNDTGYYLFTLHSRFEDTRPDHKKQSKPRSSAFIKKECDNTAFANVDSFAIGAQVLITANDQSEDKLFANGDVGILKDVRFTIPITSADDDPVRTTVPETGDWRDDIDESDKSEDKAVDDIAKKKGKKLADVVEKAAANDEEKSEKRLEDLTAEAEAYNAESVFRLSKREKKLIKDGQTVYKSVWWSKLTDEARQRYHGRLSEDEAIDKLIVTLERTDADIFLTRQTVECKDGKSNIQHTIQGFPLRLGWALTIHKTQGMTVDNAWLDMESILHMPEVSRHGLAYVGLSRVRTLEGLRISSWRPDVVFCDPEVQHLI